MLENRKQTVLAISTKKGKTSQTRKHTYTHTRPQRVNIVVHKLIIDGGKSLDIAPHEQCIYDAGRTIAIVCGVRFRGTIFERIFLHTHTHTVKLVFLQQ